MKKVKTYEAWTRSTIPTGQWIYTTISAKNKKDAEEKLLKQKVEIEKGSLKLRKWK